MNVTRTWWRALGLASLTVLLAACTTDALPETDLETYDTSARGWSVTAQATSNGIKDGLNYLSDLNPTFVYNDWGPLERDMNNGKGAAGDGGPIKLDGVTYPKGLGVFAPSEIKYNLANQCSSFKAVVGLDDFAKYQGSIGRVVFRVFGDGKKLFDSGRLGVTSKAVMVNVSVSNVSTLRLLVTEGGNTNFDDMADWADAKLECKVASTGGQYQSLPVPFANSTIRTLQIGGDAVPVVIDNQQTVRRFDGSQWQTLGQPVSSGFFGLGDAQLTLDASNRPVVLLTESSTAQAASRQPSNTRAVAKRWNGTTWESFATTVCSDSSGFYCTATTIAMDATGNPIVLVDATTPGSTVTSRLFRRWNGQTWITEVNSSFPETIIALLRDANDTSIFVAYSSSASAAGTTYTLTVRAWSRNGSRLVTLGSTSLGQLSSVNGFGAVLDASGKVFVSYMDTAQGKWLVKRLDATFLDTNLNASSSQGGILATTPSGQVHAAWGSDVVVNGLKPIVVQSWNGTAWVSGPELRKPSATTLARVDAFDVDVNGNPSIASSTATPATTSFDRFVP